ncbi:electron transport complex subunit RsxA [bacterium]|nr:electron transport complex subunit RsxA [candidate division CSSED10-310 bacterium]
MTIGMLLMLSIYAMLVNNVVLMQFLGICPYLGVSKKSDTATGMGLAVIFVMTLATAFTWLIDHFVLIRFDLVFLRTIVFILVIAALVQFVEIFLKKSIPALYRNLGIYLPLITTNCAILGTAILAVQKDYSFLVALVYAVSTGIGFLIAIILFASIRERLDTSEVPEIFRGVAISLISASILSMAFMGFAGLVRM